MKSGTVQCATVCGDRRYAAVTFEGTARIVMLGLLFITHTNSF